MADTRLPVQTFFEYLPAHKRNSMHWGGLIQPVASGPLGISPQQNYFSKHAERMVRQANTVREAHNRIHPSAPEPRANRV